MLASICRLLRSPRIVCFLLWCIFVGICTSLVSNFLFWHLEELAEQTSETTAATNTSTCSAAESATRRIKTLQGFASSVQMFGGEIPFFFLSGALLRRIGHANAMSLVLAGFAVRFLLYAGLRNIWWVLPVELLQGITYGVFFATMASYASKVAPEGAEATMQVYFAWHFELHLAAFNDISSIGFAGPCRCSLPRHRFVVGWNFRRLFYGQTGRTSDVSVAWLSGYDCVCGACYRSSYL